MEWRTIVEKVFKLYNIVFLDVLQNVPPPICNDQQNDRNKYPFLFQCNIYFYADIIKHVLMHQEVQCKHNREQYQHRNFYNRKRIVSYDSFVYVMMYDNSIKSSSCPTTRTSKSHNRLKGTLPYLNFPICRNYQIIG